jgi:hypothetical protein
MEDIMNERIQRVYVYSSVVSGVFDYHMPERVEHAKLFWQSVVDGTIRVVASDVLDKESDEAPQYVRDFFDGLPTSQIERVLSTDESDALANKYIADNVVGQSSLTDCRHIALATLNHVDVLVSWNFKHIVNLTRIRGYNSVNMRLGYPIIEIRTPEEVLYD